MNNITDEHKNERLNVRLTDRDVFLLDRLVIDAGKPMNRSEMIRDLIRIASVLSYSLVKEMADEKAQDWSYLKKDMTEEQREKWEELSMKSSSLYSDFVDLIDNEMDHSGPHMPKNIYRDYLSGLLDMFLEDTCSEENLDDEE